MEREPETGKISQLPQMALGYMWAIEMSPIVLYNGDTTYKHHMQLPEHC